MTTEKETLQRVQGGLYHLRRGLTPFVEARMKPRHGGNWLHYASRAQGGLAAPATAVAVEAPRPAETLPIRPEGEETSGKALRPWIEVALPHPDVLANRFKEADFAANLGAVAAGAVSDDYATPESFFRIT